MIRCPKTTWFCPTVRRLRLPGGVGGNYLTITFNSSQDRFVFLPGDEGGEGEKVAPVRVTPIQEIGAHRKSLRIHETVIFFILFFPTRQVSKFLLCIFGLLAKTICPFCSISSNLLFCSLCIFGQPIWPLCLVNLTFLFCHFKSLVLSLRLLLLSYHRVT